MRLSPSHSTASSTVTGTRKRRCRRPATAPGPWSPSTATWSSPAPSTSVPSRCSAPASSAPTRPCWGRRRSAPASAWRWRPTTSSSPPTGSRGPRFTGVSGFATCCSTGAATSGAWTFRAHAGTSRSACPSAARPATPWVRPSRCGNSAKAGRWSAPWATAPPPRVSSTSRSTWPAPGGCRWSSWSTTTSGPSPCPGPPRAPPKPWPRRRSPRAFPACRWTATTRSRSTTSCWRRSPGRAPAKARR